ncbi:protein kinase family protein [Paenibacillus sp. FSL H7-689]|uniref:protein kinase family protein n=1 Tax=Paenibacillus sp. FSL H7-689 TaxID=1227349 RepID=UPI0003E1E3BD|nr:protein kinase family protein [Paenibacillus sp. FSL H7-689]ETT56077.1 serine/threonine protein kinase [Paenibacillus sp. FSL H7-689]
MLKPGEIVKFNSMKHFKHISTLGSGGTGDAHLFKDETTDMLFAFKKYSPKGSNDNDDTFKRFVDEIKILFTLSHENIVRVYNYYLYPEAKSGYLQMEYVEGVSIDQFEPYHRSFWEDIFKDVIYVFEYLEENQILHRDIRPSNILIDKNDKLKIIDFGFGKKLEIEEREGRSVFLNWPVSQLPVETQLEGIYSHQTEIFFVGKLFQNLFKNKGIEDFKYNYIIEKMIKIDPSTRYRSFPEIAQTISAGVMSEINFTTREKEIYQYFADTLFSHISSLYDKYDPIIDIDVILDKLANLIRNSSLETYIQHNSQLINCFIKGVYKYKKNIDIQVATVKKFYEFLVKLDSDKQKIVIDNIRTRLANINIIITDDLPF